MAEFVPLASAEPLIDLGVLAAGHQDEDRDPDPVRASRGLMLALAALLALVGLGADAAAAAPRGVLTVDTARGEFQVVGDVLYVFDGPYPPNRVAAYGLRDGRRRWRITAPAGTTYENVWRAGARTLLVPNACAALRPVTTLAVDTGSGHEVWRRSGVPEEAVAGGRLVVMSRPGPTFGCGTGYSPTEARPTYWDAVDVTTGALAWSIQVPAYAQISYDSADPTGPRRVVFATPDGTVTSRDLATGAVTGRVTLPELARPARLPADAARRAGAPEVTVAGDQAIVSRHVPGTAGELAVTGYDVDTLASRWSVRVDAGPAGPAPEGSDYADYIGLYVCARMLCVDAPNLTVFLDPRDGRERWRTALVLLALGGQRALFSERAGDRTAPDERLTIRDTRTGAVRGDLTGWRVFTGTRGDVGTPVLGFAARGRTWFAWLDLGSARLSSVGSVPGVYYSCVGAEGFLVCRGIDGTVHAWQAGPNPPGGFGG